MNSVPPFIPEHPLIEHSDQFNKLAVIGVSARTAGRRLRDNLFVEEPDFQDVLSELKENDRSSVVLIATCERFDFLLGDIKDDDVEFYLNLIAKQAQIDLETLKKQSYQHTGLNALRHIFAVSSSLDSLIVGEPQILGQVKDCHRLSMEQGLTDGFLDDVVNASLISAKRVRTETTIAQQPITLASSALQVAKGIHGELGRCSVLLVGGGEVGELLCGEFKAANIGNLIISNPRLGRSETTVFRLGGEAAPWEDLDQSLVKSDIILSAYGGGDCLFTSKRIKACLRSRKRKPVFIIDTTASRDVDPEVNTIDGVFSYNLGDLENVAKQGKVHRETAMMAAWKILGQEMQAFIRKKVERQAAPVISLLRKHLDGLRAQVLSECGQDAEAATRLLVNRLLHNPQRVLKETTRENPEEHNKIENMLCRLFSIDTPQANKAGVKTNAEDEVKED